MGIISYINMKLSEWARKHDLSYPTAYSLFKRNQLPVKSIQLETGTILILEDENVLATAESLKTYVYARVSSANKKDDLERQAERCLSFCAANGWQVEKVIKEVASGMNDNRKKLLSLLDKNPKRIVVEHKDRLTRFGFNYFDTLLPLLGYQIVVINRDQIEENDLIKDMISIITSYCCRFYGLRKGKNKVLKIKEILKDEEKE